MARKKKREIVAEHFFDESLENIVTSTVYDSEFTTAESNQEGDIADYESVIDMLECRRSEKNYDWMSDVFIPELPSILLTDAGGWANQYFQSRGYVECVLEDGTPQGLEKCRAAKRLINGTLNRKDLYYFHKFIRARNVNSTAGRVFAVCWWNRNEELVETGETTEEPTGLDQFGNPVDDPSLSETRQIPVMGTKTLRDSFDFDIVDPANIFTDSRYVYNIQDKDWVIIRSEKSYYELLPMEGEFGYINLGVMKSLDDVGEDETAASKASYNKFDNKQMADKTPIKRWDVYERFGKYWVVEGENGIEPGIDVDGKPLDNAELAETVITVAVKGSNKVLIRFQKQRNETPSGVPYRPIVRGLCYIHPRKDEGLSDGKYLREAQIAINDNFNIGMDRVKLATLPTLIGRKYALQDNETIYFEPEHVMEVDDPTTDLKELTISDNITGTIEMNHLLASKMQQVSSVYPTTMGDLPQASNTATAVAGAESRANLRANYKSLTFENTFLIDFYSMILNMTYQYATDETKLAMMGEDAQYFDPEMDYTFTPVSSNVELDASKDRKIQRYDQMLARIAPFAQNPKIHILVNFILSRMFELQGDEFSIVRKMLLDEKPPPMEEGTGNGTQTTDLQAEPASNQFGNLQTPQEALTRGGSGGIFGGGQSGQE